MCRNLDRPKDPISFSLNSRRRLRYFSSQPSIAHNRPHFLISPPEVVSVLAIGLKIDVKYYEMVLLEPIYKSVNLEAILSYTKVERFKSAVSVSLLRIYFNDF